ncbi:minor tail protein [Mycobacterium phage Luchador]|uniref:Minor tail protein n=1 Tax=Mycobacterium phage Luchador TaxID=1647300 RepID=A0A0F6WDR2_9CAUD|nr:minor tail protein [Mycobacterium phage Luchador]AKF14196.1 minor tail protein [Mycobacterium phage Luchador]
MNGLFNPDSWQDVVLLAFVALCGMGGTVLPVWLNQKRHSKQLGEIKNQVSNDHSTNLRDDIDELVLAVRQVVEKVADVKVDVRDVKSDIGGLREELRTERVERIEGDRLRVVVNNQRG